VSLNTDDKDTSGRGDAPSTVPVSAGQVIGGRYEVRSVIAHGGMGIVCEAIHLELGTPVAVKFIHSDLVDNPDMVQRFLNEARTAAGLRSEHIARVYDAGRLDSGEQYLVMERLDGTGLDELIKESGPLEPAEAVDLVLQACEGLAEAHAVGLVHRDIKPANLFLTRRPDGRPFVKVLDFGISKRLLDVPLGLTDPRSSIGSPWYMSPEQMKNASSVNQRTDIWSLGVVLFELLTATHPFEGRTVPEVCSKVLTEPAPLLRSKRADADPRLEAIISRCLEKEADDRYPTVASLAESLAPCGSGLVTPVASQPSWKPSAGRTAGAKESGERDGGTQDLGLDLTTFAPMEGAIDRRRPWHRSTKAWIGATMAFGVGVASTWFVLNPQSVGYLRTFQSAASSLGLRYPWQPVLGEAFAAEEPLSSSWSACPLIVSGAFSSRPLIRDGLGRATIAAERELDVSVPRPGVDRPTIARRASERGATPEQGPEPSLPSPLAPTDEQIPDSVP
jgi:serine/threonine-protein kinase